MKTVVVTGGSGGIGSAIAEKLKKSGYNVVITFFSNQEKAKSLAERCGIDAVYCDVGSTESVVKAFGEIREKHGGLYGLVNCAGVAIEQKVFTSVTDEELDRLYRINVKGTFNCAKCAVEDMISNKEGRIVNVSSIWGVLGGSCEVAYSATKGAVNAMTMALARELGLSGITVNAVAPGFVDTAMNARLSKEEKEAFYEGLSLPRAGLPEEIAEAVLFLLRDGYVTGQIIRVDGGA